jgi:hypothetical protein
VDTVTCRGQASKLLDTIFERARHDLATPKQVKWLKRFGHPSPHTATFKEASEILTRRFNNNKQHESRGTTARELATA